MSVTYAGDPSVSDVAAVRFELGDTDVSAPLLQDEEIDWAIAQESGIVAGTPATIAPANLYRSAARCMVTLARRFAAQADTQVGSLKTTYSAQAETYAKRAQELLAKAAGSAAPYAGGTSASDKHGLESDPDREQPAFRRRQFENPWADQPGGDQLPDLGPFIG